MRFRWWIPSIALSLLLVCVLALEVMGLTHANQRQVGSTGWWIVTGALHLPYLVILLFFAGGFVERIGYYWRGRHPHSGGRLPSTLPTVCVQLPMFNEHAVAERVIMAASALTWPTDRLSIQVLDDSTDSDTRVLVEDVCARVRATTGVRCYVLHRSDRQGYKAGALEAGRHATDAEFLAIFDADFVPPRDFLVRAMRHFYDTLGRPLSDLALVQAQWGHLNHDESSLTQAQSLWVDDHHTLQMSWRSAAWQFVNFTGTAGVWRSAAIESVGGWRAASLVEDCELSFRHLFAGYRTTFIKEIVAPAELPATFTAYKAQQKRWTQGWVQLQRLHLGTLLLRHACHWPRRLHLAYHMCISWQWPAWGLWITLSPGMIHAGYWLGEVNAVLGGLLYLMPGALWVILMGVSASMATKHTYPDDASAWAGVKRIRRVIPFVVISAGMLPHQCSAFMEGLFGSLHSEFERTPKAATVSRGTAEARQMVPAVDGRSRTQSTPRWSSVKVHWPYVLTELFFVIYLLAWVGISVLEGHLLPALCAAYVAGCVLYVAYFYGDHAGKVCFILGKDDARPTPARVGLHRPSDVRPTPAPGREVVGAPR